MKAAVHTISWNPAVYAAAGADSPVQNYLRTKPESVASFMNVIMQPYKFLTTAQVVQSQVSVFVFFFFFFLKKI